MLYLLLSATLLFVCSTFFLTVSQQASDQILTSYFFFQLSFINAYFSLFFLAFVTLTVVFFRSNFDKKFSPFKILFFSTIQTVFVFFFGFISSFALLMFIAFVHLNIFSVILNTNPAMLGVVTDTKKIAKVLQNNVSTAKIIIADNKEQKTLFSIAKATSGTHNFYGRSFLSSIPNLFIVSLQNIEPSMALIDNTLIVTRIDEAQLETMSPLLGYLLVKQYFPRRFIKSYPKVTIMDLDEYRVYREEDSKKKIVKIDAAIEKMEGTVSSLSASLVTDPQHKRTTKKLLAEYQYYGDFLKNQKEKLQGAQEYIPNELGVFKDPDSIKMIFSGTDESANRPSTVDYLATLVHEYLHYATYISDEQRIGSTFFEEGLTEYFARAAIQKSLETRTNLGYPVQVKILTAMTQMFTESELAEIYFTKDEEVLVHALNRVYGDHFYEDNYVAFESLQYTANPKQALELANAIMGLIGGEALTEKDLTSSYSSL